MRPSLNCFCSCFLSCLSSRSGCLSPIPIELDSAHPIISFATVPISLELLSLFIPVFVGLFLFMSLFILITSGHIFSQEILLHIGSLAYMALLLCTSACSFCCYSWLFLSLMSRCLLFRTFCSLTYNFDCYSFFGDIPCYRHHIFSTLDFCKLDFWAYSHLRDLDGTRFS